MTESSEGPIQLTFPILPIDELIHPFLTKRFLVAINPIKSFREFFEIFPMVGIADRSTLGQLGSGAPLKITYGKIKSCQESHSASKEALYELDIEGLGVGVVQTVIRDRPLTVVQVEKFPYQELVLKENSFKAGRLRRYCEYFLANNLPFEEDQIFWRDELKGNKEIVSFLAMVFLNHEEKWQFLQITDINVQMDFLLEKLPPLQPGQTSKVLTFPESCELPPPLPL